MWVRGEGTIVRLLGSRDFLVVLPKHMGVRSTTRASSIKVTFLILFPPQNDRQVQKLYSFIRASVKHCSMKVCMHNKKHVPTPARKSCQSGLKGLKSLAVKEPVSETCMARNTQTKSDDPTCIGEHDVQSMLNARALWCVILMGRSANATIGNKSQEVPLPALYASVKPWPGRERCSAQTRSSAYNRWVAKQET